MKGVLNSEINLDGLDDKNNEPHLSDWARACLDDPQWIFARLMTLAVKNHKFDFDDDRFDMVTPSQYKIIVNGILYWLEAELTSAFGSAVGRLENMFPHPHREQ